MALTSFVSDNKALCVPYWRDVSQLAKKVEIMQFIDISSKTRFDGFVNFMFLEVEFFFSNFFTALIP